MDVSLDDLVNYDRENSNNLGLGVPPKGKHVFGITKVGEKGQIVIPAKARKIFDIQPGDNLIMLENNSEFISLKYTVDIGVVEKRGTDENGKEYKNQLEIDFVANLGSKRYYIQSALSMPTEEKRIQEKASLVNVNDSFKKIIVVKDVVNVTRDEDGITTMSIYDFLLKENSLEL